jgi:SEC-C motif
MSSDRVSRNDPCPCGSGRKFKHCCGGAGAGRSENYPLATVARYGPDDKSTTKVVAAVFAHDGAEPVLERWVGTDVDTSPKVRAEVAAFLAAHGAKKVVAVPEVLGCPHEEGEDFPLGEDCPFCPFWNGKQGTARRDDVI